MSAHASRVSARRVVADVVVQFAGQAATLVLGIVVTVLLVRTLGATRYGQWSTVLAVIELVGVAGNLGLENIAVRFATAEPHREGTWIGAVTSLRITISIPVMAVFIGVLVLLAADTDMLLMGLIMSLLYLSSAWSTLRAVFRLRVRNDITVVLTTVNSVLWAAAVIALSIAGGGEVAFALAFVGIQLAVQTALAVLAMRTIPIRWRGARELWPRIARVGIAVGIASALTFAYGRIDQILVYELAPEAQDAGLYAAMYKLLDSVGFIPIAVMTTLFPIMSSAWPADPPRLRRLMQITIDYLTMVSVGGVALTIVAAEPIVDLLFGREFRPAAGALPILMASFVPICVGSVVGDVVLATNLQRRYVWFAGVGLIINVALNVALIPRYGFLAAAWITLLTEIVVVGLALAAVLLRVRMRLSLRRIALTAIAAALAGLAVWGLRQAGATVAVLLIAMGVVYPLLLLGCRAVDIGELRGLLAERRGAPASE